MIKSDIESGDDSSPGRDFSGDLTNDISGRVSSSSSSNSIMNKQHASNSDIVDSSDYPILSDNKKSFEKLKTTAAAGELNTAFTTNRYILSSSSSTVKSENTTSQEACFSVPTSPTSLTTPIIEPITIKQRESANSVPTSPESGAQEIVLRRSQQQQNGVVRRNDAAGFRTSRSEDHLQHSQRDILGAVVPIDIDEDVNSSLNTLLDTRQDSEDSQVIFLMNNQ